MERLQELEEALRRRVQREERALGSVGQEPDSLWDHQKRVAVLAVALGRAEGVDPKACYLAGLFHDAGKFSGGCYHEGEIPEEERSIAILYEMAATWELDPELCEQVADAIEQLYRDNAQPGPLARVLFDADNLDKLGHLGIANFFIKAGLRGGGVNHKLLYQLTRELTYARNAARCMMTSAGRKLASEKAPLSVSFLEAFLDELRVDGLFDFRISQVEFDEFMIDVVSPAACACGASLERRIWTEQGVKCTEVHLEHACGGCGARRRLRFCKPRLAT